MGAIMRPRLVKKRETSLPCSARRAIASADTGFFDLRMLLIKLSLLPGCFPESYEVVEFSSLVLPHLKNDSVEPLPDPAEGAVLLRHVRPLIEVIRAEEHLLYLLEADSPSRVRSQPPAFPLVKMESHKV